MSIELTGVGFQILNLIRFIIVVNFLNYKNGLLLDYTLKYTIYDS